MKIEIEQNCTGTGKFRWKFFTGPEHIDEYTGTTDTLGECFQEIIRMDTLNSQQYCKVVKVEESQSFYDKLWELISTKVGNNTNADELTDRIMDLIKDQYHTEDSFVAAVNDLAARTHKSKAEVLRNAVNLYYTAVNEWEENGRGVVFQQINNKPEPTDEEICDWGDYIFLPSLSKAEKLSFPITDKDLRIIVRAALAHWK